MRFSTFISEKLDEIVIEWEQFARTQRPSGASMPALALRDHARDILKAVATAMDSGQSAAERVLKSQNVEPHVSAGPESAATAHGALRQLEGFDLPQLFGEFRALRASVLAMWRLSVPSTDTQTAIEEIARFNEGIDQAAAESLERYTKDIAIFMAVIGHDLRSPLWAIQNSADMLSTRVVSEDVRREAMLRIARSSKTMGHAITDLIEFSDTHLGRRISLQLAVCDLGQVCDKALAAMRAVHPRQHFDLTLNGDLRLRADARRMEQVFLNLVNNAVHHGGQRAPVSIVLEGSADRVVIQVTNHGKPISPERLQSIFEPEVEMPAASLEAYEGGYTGLGVGLFIVKEVVSRHGGTVDVRSDSLTGTVVFITLPRHPVDSRPK